MGTYVSQTDLERRFGAERLVELTQDDTSLDTVDTDVLAEVIADAEAMVDGYVGARYSLPLSSPPAILTRLAAILTWYQLHERRHGAPENVAKDYANAMRSLRDISSGVLTLGTQPEPSVNAGKKIHSTSSAPTFGRDNLKGF